MRLMFNCCQCCDARLWSSYAKNLGVCPECEEPDKPLQDLEDDLESIFNQPESTMYIIWKTNKINNRNLRYWSDDGGLSWYWIGSRKP